MRERLPRDQKRESRAASKRSWRVARSSHWRMMISPLDQLLKRSIRSLMRHERTFHPSVTCGSWSSPQSSLLFAASYMDRSPTFLLKQSDSSASIPSYLCEVAGRPVAGISTPLWMKRHTSNAMVALCLPSSTGSMWQISARVASNQHQSLSLTERSKYSPSTELRAGSGITSRSQG